MAVRNPHLIARRIIQDAGGELVGRTRLQKVAYLMQLAGFSDEDLGFEYRHFGPYSEDLAHGISIAAALGSVTEVEKKAAWGGKYSVYSVGGPIVPDDPRRADFVQRASKIGAVELELAATAAFLYAAAGIGRAAPGNPWDETSRRKPEKAGDGRIERAQGAYRDLRNLPTPIPLPPLP